MGGKKLEFIIILKKKFFSCLFNLFLFLVEILLLNNKDKGINLCKLITNCQYETLNCKSNDCLAETANYGKY